MTPHDIIKRLDNLDLHDLVVESLEFLGDEEVRLIVTTLPYDDETGEYQTLKFEFSQIIELTTDRIIMDAESELELNSFDYEYNKYFNCKMVFLTGSGKPSLTIELKCKGIELAN